MNLGQSTVSLASNLVVIAACLWPGPSAQAAERAKPNVLFIAIDDQNDWIGCLGGHPAAKTPNIDRLAARGTLFTNAHCQAPLCNPSRTSVLLGLRPTTSGVYGLAPYCRTVDALKDRVSLPQHFQRHGYRTLTVGKIFHQVPPKDRPREFDEWGPTPGVGAPMKEKLIPPTPMGNVKLMDWGVYPGRDEDMGDYRVASWAIEQLQTAPKDKPFFLACGFALPHVPCYATQRWFDLYPDDDSLLPRIREDDRNDTPRFSWYLHWYLPEPRLKWVRENHQWRNLARSYLASVSFMDSQIGRVLDALEQAGQRDNTVVVLWSDHGWHVGEKLITGKNTLWERSTHVPLVFAGPGVSGGARCAGPVELLDMYPTLVELCGLTRRDDLEGHSLAPQLKDAQASRPWPAITSHNQGNHAVRTDRWRYIRYADGSQELYDMQADPREWTNLAARPEHAKVISELSRWLPKVDVGPVPGSAQRILTYDPRTKAVTWEGKPVGPNDPIPE
ncbi:MAG: sulfatase [Planctomycetes bacterium]|nr:sulfatase [Planctomycetota bacterium]